MIKSLKIILYVLFILRYLLFLFCLSIFYDNITYSSETYTQSRYKCSQDAHIFKSPCPMHPGGCLHMLGRSMSCPRRIMYQLLGTACSLIKCVFGLPLSPTVRTDYSTSDTWHAVKRVEIRHDTWDRREETPGRIASKKTWKINLNQILPLALEFHAVNVWFNNFFLFCLHQFTPNTVCCSN